MSTPISFRRSIASLILCALFLSSALSITATAAPDGTIQALAIQVSKPLPPAQYIPDHDFDTRHIALDLRFDWDKEQLLGRETLVFAPLVTDLKAIKLD